MTQNRSCFVAPDPADPTGPGLFDIRESPIPTNIAGDSVLIKACSIWSADKYDVLSAMGAQFPLVTGHEIAGKVTKAGPGPAAQTFREGEMVGVGWHADNCSVCETCTVGDLICCEKLKITGIHVDGGYQKYMVANANALARVPEGMDAVTAAPLMCAGVTVFNGLRSNMERARPPALVAVVGIGCLGHLAIQYAVKLGFVVAAVSRGQAKREEALQLGATHYIDATADKVAHELKALGSAKIVMCTGTKSTLMASCMAGLGRNGKLLVMGVSAEPIPVMPYDIIDSRKSVAGFPARHPRDCRDAMEFAQQHGISPRNVVYHGIEAIPEAFATVLRGELHGGYRAVTRMD